MDNKYKWLIYDSESACQQRLNKAANDLPPTLSGTYEYGYMIKHPDYDLWALPISEDFIYLFPEYTTAVELTDDWFEIDINTL